MLPDVAVCKASNITTGVVWEAELLQGMESLGQCVAQGVAAMACHIAIFTPIICPPRKELCVGSCMQGVRCMASYFRWAGHADPRRMT